MQLLDIGLNRTFNAVVPGSNPGRPTNLDSTKKQLAV